MQHWPAVRRSQGARISNKVAIGTRNCHCRLSRMLSLSRAPVTIECHTSCRLSRAQGGARVACSMQYTLHTSPVTHIACKRGFLSTTMSPVKHSACHTLEHCLPRQPLTSQMHVTCKSSRVIIRRTRRRFQSSPAFPHFGDHCDSVESAFDIDGQATSNSTLFVFLKTRMDSTWNNNQSHTAICIITSSSVRALVVDEHDDGRHSMPEQS
jgi:hypothetical protein